MPRDDCLSVTYNATLPRLYTDPSPRFSLSHILPPPLSPMELTTSPAPASVAAVSSISLLLFLLLLASPGAEAHNITHILAKHPELSTFNHYLTLTHLASEINRRLTITVLAVDNAAMSELIAKHLSIGTIKNVLSLHVLVDYFGTKKLHQLSQRSTSTSTLFQASGAAPGTAGFVNITDLKGGKVGFGVTEVHNVEATFVKSIIERPYNISVLQISQVLTSPEVEAPTGAPSDLNLTEILTKQGCKAFADLITSSGAEATYQENIDSGLTVFCPPDSVVNGFMPKYKNLTKAQKTSLILYHGVPIFMFLQGLKSSNGPMNTLATNGASKYHFTVLNDGDDVTLKTKVVTAKVTGTVVERDPPIVFKVDKFLQPKELFKATEAAPAPKTGKRKKSNDRDVSDDDDDADSPDREPLDDTADDRDAAAGLVAGGRLVAGSLLLSLFLSMAIL
ncbi:hypothetical protein SAY86_016644 [Trapa natans]|uniref:FAS1 domain-containing protein n=1 Tax=Trapa natans TaxID=22666 RepID=A0AAN7LM57_TRANT|nr:hypothetical protein SAY86_016644 [Trapa natans]